MVSSLRVIILDQTVMGEVDGKEFAILDASMYDEYVAEMSKIIPAEVDVLKRVAFLDVL